MHILPVDLRANVLLHIVDNHICLYRDSSENLDGREGHQVEVAPAVEVAVAVG